MLIGDEDASKMKDVVAKYMTSEQLAKAQELARECIKKNYKDCGLQFDDKIIIFALIFLM